MSHGASQSTLDGAPAPPFPEALRPLTLVDAAALLAFFRATRERSPISPSLELTFALADWLESRGWLRICRDDDHADTAPPVRAIYDPLAWRYILDGAAAPEFEARLVERVRTLAADPASRPIQVALWRELAQAELEGYLGALLRRHGFDARWAIDVRELSATWIEQLPLGRLRYVVWAAVREGAAVFLREAGDLDETREAISRELRRRAAWLDSRPDLGTGFMPAPGTRQSLLLTVFLDFARIGAEYWAQCPSERVLATSERADE